MRIPTPAVALVLLSFSFAGFGKSYQADQYNVLLQLDSAGGLTVTETATFHFEGGPFTYVFRDISATGTDGISEVRAWMGGQLCRLGTGPGEVEVKGRSPVAVRWHFAPMVDGTQTFTVQYRAAGTVRNAGNSQELIWRALPPDRKYRIAASDIAIEYPAAVSPSMVGLRSAGQVFEIGPGRAFTRLVDSPARTPVVVDARFPAGSFTGPEPAWTRAVERRDEDMRSGARIGAVVAAFYLALVCLWMFGVRASAKLESDGPQGGEMVMSPPSTLPPALAASLIGQAGLVLGTLLDLARRHVVRLEEKNREGGRARQYQVVWRDAAAKLTDSETTLLHGVFGSAGTVRLQHFLQSYPAGFGAAVRTELIGAGLFDPARLRARSKLLSAGGLGFAGGLALLLIGIVGRVKEFMELAAGCSVVGASMILAGLLALILGATQRVWTRAGAAEAFRWKSFNRYLARVARGLTALPGQADLDRFLPYAGAFGLMTPLLKRQAKQDGGSLPGWLPEMQNAAGTNADSMVAFTSVCDACTSSGGGAASGAAASGGGASGAG